MPTDPVRNTIAKMKGLDARTTLDHIRSAIVKAEDFYDTNSRLGRFLEERVVLEANEYVPLASAAVTLSSNEITAAFFYGLRKSVATGDVEFSDADVEHLLQAADDLKGIHKNLPSRHRSWVLHSFADLAREMARQATPSWITANKQLLLVKLCEALLHTTNPEPGIVEENYPSLQTEWISQSINSSSGYLGHAISQLAANTVFAMRHENRIEFELAEGEALSLQRKIFTELTDPLLRVAYGGFLPFFWQHKKDFFEEIYDDVFPNDENLWLAVWSGYSNPRTRTASLYHRLEKEYIRSIRLLEKLTDESENLGTLEWSQIAANDVALFWQANQIDESDPVLAKMSVVKHDWILSSIPDVIAVTLKGDDESNQKSLRAVELIRIIQRERHHITDSSNGEYWSRLQLLLNELPSGAWADELQESLRKCLSYAEDSYYFKESQFLHDLKEHNLDLAIELLLLMSNRTRNHPWLVRWFEVETVVEELRADTINPRYLSVLDEVEKTLNRTQR